MLQRHQRLDDSTNDSTNVDPTDLRTPTPNSARTRRSFARWPTPKRTGSPPPWAKASCSSKTPRAGRSGSRISGDDAFALSDTFGIPREQIQEWAAEAGLTVDTDRFAELLQEQRDRARAARKKVEVGLEAGAVPPTEFVGYHETQAETPIALVLDEGSEQLEAAEEGQAVRVFLDRTPFYAEGGGQVGDQGLIRTDTGMVRVTDTVPAGGHATMHLGTVESGEVRPARSPTPRSTWAAVMRPRAPTPPRTSCTGR